MKKLFLLFWMSVIGLNVYGQSYAPEINVIPPSPDVMALHKYIDFPVSNYTGTPQINLPIYTIRMNSFSVPISLNYHASGLKVDEYASWVGAGWSLDAGGAISRNVRGVPDEYDGSHRGYFNSLSSFWV